MGMGDLAAAQAKLDAASKDRRATIHVDVDTAAVGRIGSALSSIGGGAVGLLQFPAIAAGITLAAAALVQVAVGLGAVVAAAAPAAGVLGAIPGLLAAAVQGVGGVIVGFRGIGDAVKASGQAETAAAAASASASAARAAAAQRIVAAQDRVRQAQASAANAAANAARQIQQAEQGLANARQAAARSTANAAQQVAEAQRQSLERVADAERDRTSAVRDARAAERDLIEARREAVRQLEDLNARVTGGRLSLEQAQIDLERARNARESTFSSATSTGLDKRQADLNFREAQQRLEDQRREQGRLENEARVANRNGVEGSELVRRAKQRVSDANARIIESERALRRTQLEGSRRVAEAERDLRDAQVAGAQRVREAEETLANARRSAAFSVLSANHQVLLAQRDLADAQANATVGATQQSAAQTKLAEAMDALSPAGRRFVAFLIGTLIPAWERIKKATQEALLPPVQRGLTALLPLLRVFQAGLVGTATVLGGAFERLAVQYLATPLFRRDFATLMASNNRVLGLFGRALLPLARAFTDLAIAAQPMVERFARFVLSMAQSLANFTRVQRATGGLTRFFQLAGDTAAILWGLLGNIGAALLNIGRAAAPAGRLLLGSLSRAAERLREITGSVEGQNRLRDYFLRTVPMVRETGRLVNDLVIGLLKLGDNPGLTSLINQIRTRMLPALLRMAQALNDTAGPALVELITNIAELVAVLAEGGGGPLAAFLNTLSAMVRALTALVQIPGLGQVVTTIGSLAAGFAALALAAGPVLKFIGLLGKLNKGIGGVLARMGLVAAGTGGVGAAMAALTGPVGLIVLAIAALATGLYVAYQRSATFRRIVDTALRAVGDSAIWLWENAIVPAFEGIREALRVVGEAATALWRRVIVPTFTGISRVITWWYRNVTEPIMRELVDYWQRVLAPATRWLWRNVFQPIFTGIGNVVRFWWNNVTKPTFDRFLAFLRTVVFPTINFLWRNVVSPAFTGISFIIRTVVAAVTTIMRGLTNLLANVVGPAISRLWRSVVVPAFNGIRAIISSVWRNGISPVFAALRTGIDRVASAFRTGVGLIGRLWAGLRAAVSGPVRFVVDTIYNNGIRGIWNRVAGLIKSPLLPELRIPGLNAPEPNRSNSRGARPSVAMARGGVVPGYAPGKDTVNALVSPGEGWLVPEAVRGLARDMRTTPQKAIGTINATYSSRVIGPSLSADGRPAFAGGGVMEWVGEQIGRGAGALRRGSNAVRSTLSDATQAMANAVIGSLGPAVAAATRPLRDLIGRVLPTSVPFTGLLNRATTNMLGRVVSYVTQRDQETNVAASGADPGMGGGGNGPGPGYVPGRGVARWSNVVLQALRIVGQPASLLPVVLRRMNQESGGNPTIVNRWDSNWQRGTPSVGLMQVIGPTFQAFARQFRNVGPFSYGTSTNPLANIVSSMFYALSRYGSLARAYNRQGGYDSGGLLQPGTTLVHNGTGRPEVVFTGEQWDLLRRVINSAAVGNRLTRTTDSGLSGANITIPVQATPGMNTQELARAVAVELGWMLR